MFIFVSRRGHRSVVQSMRPRDERRLMSRFVAILVAAAASVATAAAVTLPAGAGDKNRVAAETGPGDFTACLRAEGLAVPADVDDDDELKRWWEDARPRDPATVDDAVGTCKQRIAGRHGDKDTAESTRTLDEIAVCLRRRGLDVPSGSLDRIKTWLSGTIARNPDNRAVRACGVR
jgi:hypothetical protein